MKDLLTYVVKYLVENPEDVAINEIAGEQTTVYELRVHQDDLGKVIGKQGRTARAIRTVMSAAGVRDNKRIMLEILD